MQPVHWHPAFCGCLQVGINAFTDGQESGKEERGSADDYSHKGAPVGVKDVQRLIDDSQRHQCRIEPAAGTEEVGHAARNNQRAQGQREDDQGMVDNFTFDFSAQK